MQGDQDKSTRFEMRAPVEWVAIVDNWRRRQHTIPSRADAIRKLVNAGVAAHYLADKVLMNGNLDEDIKHFGGKLLIQLIESKIKNHEPGSYIIDPDFPKSDPDPGIS